MSFEKLHIFANHQIFKEEEEEEYEKEAEEKEENKGEENKEEGKEEDIFFYNRITKLSLRVEKNFKYAFNLNFCFPCVSTFCFFFPFLGTSI